MKLWAAISQAIAGWIKIVRGDPDWRQHFVFTAPGLVTALLVFALAAFLGVALASLNIGFPSQPGALAAMLVLALPLLAFVISIFGTRALLRSPQPLLPLLVPGAYSLTAFLLIEGLLAMFGGPLVMLAWLAIAYLLFRLLRAATDWHLAIAACCAVLSVVLLVGLRLALYMLSSSAGIAP